MVKKHIPEFFPVKLPYFYSFKCVSSSSETLEKWIITRHFKDNSDPKPCGIFTLDMASGVFQNNTNFFLSNSMKDHFFQWRLRIDEEEKKEKAEAVVEQFKKAAEEEAEKLATKLAPLKAEQTKKVAAAKSHATFTAIMDKLKAAAKEHGVHVTVPGPAKPPEEKPKPVSFGFPYFFDQTGSMSGPKPKFSDKHEEFVITGDFSHFTHDSFKFNYKDLENKFAQGCGINLETKVSPKGEYITRTPPQSLITFVALPDPGPTITATTADPVPPPPKEPEPPHTCPLCSAKVHNFDLFGCMHCR